MKNFANSLLWAAITATLFLAWPTSALSAQDATPLSVTEEVHTAGQVAYEARCSACHLSSFGGSFEAPELAGPNFRAVWTERSLAEFRATVRTMPPTAPNSLREAEYDAITVYLLAANGLERDGRMLQADRETTTGMSDEEWHRIMDANLSSAFYCCRAVGPHMMKQGYGKVINVSSNNGSQAYPYVAAYSVSKAGMNMLTRILALEWAPYNISVNAIGPGEFRTAMTETSWVNPEAYQRHLDNIPMGREAGLREVGLMAAYFAGPESDYVTGQIVHIDGGITAR